MCNSVAQLSLLALDMHIRTLVYSARAFLLDLNLNLDYNFGFYRPKLNSNSVNSNRTWLYRYLLNRGAFQLILMRWCS